VLYHALRYGSPRLWRVAAFLGEWLTSPSVLDRLRQNVSYIRGMRG
jgi:hypothetical protein